LLDLLLEKNKQNGKRIANIWFQFHQMSWVLRRVNFGVTLQLWKFIAVALLLINALIELGLAWLLISNFVGHSDKQSIGMITQHFDNSSEISWIE
jgi:hypothetical protein